MKRVSKLYNCTNKTTHWMGTFLRIHQSMQNNPISLWVFYLPKSLSLKENFSFFILCLALFYSSNSLLHLFTVKYFPNFT